MAGNGAARTVFISHASEDKRWARLIARALQRRGWDPWLDESGIQGGAAWAASIQRALRKSSAVVLVITSRSVSKEWVLDEVTAARNLRVPIVPAVLEHVRLPDELQFMLQRTQTVDISGLADQDDQNRRRHAVHALDDALLGILERVGELNPDRVRMRLGRVLQAIGMLMVVLGFGGFMASLFTLADSATGPPPITFVCFAMFALGGLLASAGTAMVRAGRAKGL